MGSEALIANVMRQGINYNTFDLLEDGCGINLRPLSMFADATYRMTPARSSGPRRSLTKISLTAWTRPRAKMSRPSPSR